MKKYFSIILSLLMVLVLCSCGTNSTNNGDDDSSSSVDAVTVSVDDSAYDGTTATGDFTITTEDGTYTESSGVYTISSAGTYSLSGSLEGYIYVNAGDDDEIVLELNGVNIESDVNSPIFIYNAGEVKIKSLKDTYNTITDSRDLKESDVETQGEGAIYAK
ncbi:MAG: carbohydrate-binding domain-containing protein, partial [Clostridia bacterium]|nr:carbohydrate-binding domain-containing protein [Clostridia bacterium]